MDSLVPGVTDVGNVRPRVKGGRTKEVKASMPIVQPIVQVLDPHKTKTATAINSDLSSTVLDGDSTTTTIRGKQVSLRDLCLEDKKRVANLIKELARLGEEKESAEKNLQEERQHYEEQILKLVEQQEQILSEREEVQQRLLEYQTYILKLQQQKQLEKLHQLRNLVDSEQTPSDVGRAESPSLGSRTRQATCHSVTPASHHTEQASSKLSPRNSEQAEGICDKPSKNFYMNELEDSDDDCSTRAIPSHSLTQIVDGSRPMPERPFTAMIDKEIANQKQILAASLLSHKSPLNKQASLKNYPADKIEHSTPGLLHSSPHLRDTKHNGTAAINQSPSMLDYGRETLKDGPPFGNTSLLTPEKNELISRFMQSQAEVLQSKLDLERNFDKVRHKEKGVERDAHVQKGGNLTRQKLRKAPPPSYGPWHAPIMSSTQKSSEIGDYVDSTLVSGHHQNDIMRRGRLEEVGSGTEECDRNNNHSSDDGSQTKTGGVQSEQKGEKLIQSQSSTSKSGRRSARALEFEKLERAGVDQDFLRRYKKMSPSERKQELLRQRSMLLEEQKRLKLLLAAQETQLKMKQMDALKKMDETEGLLEKDSAEIIVTEQDLERKDEELQRSQNILARHSNDTSARLARHPSSDTSPRLARHPSSDTSPREYQRVDDDKQRISPSTRRGQQLLTAGDNGDVAKAGEEADAELSAESEMKLNGKDGDECVVYVSEVKERVVKKLDYSQQSDAESNASSRKVSSRVSRENLNGSASTEAVVTRDRQRGSNREVMSSPPHHSDASTSVSYSHLPRSHKHTTETDWKVLKSRSTRSGVSNTKDKERPSRTYNSVREKTLSMLDSINSMDDPDQTSPVKDIKTDRNKIHDDRHKIYGDRHGIHDDIHDIQDDRHTIHDDRHKIYGDRHDIHDDRHDIHDDRHAIHNDRHDIHDDRHKIHDDRHKIHNDRHKIRKDSSDSDSRHTCNIIIKHNIKPDIGLSNCSQQASSLLHISRASGHQNHASDCVHSELPPTRKPSVKSGQVNHSIPPADADPNLSLFVLRRNLLEISPRPTTKSKKIISDKDRGLMGLNYDDKDGSQLNGHHGFEMLDRLMSPHSVNRMTSGDEFEGIDIMLQTIDAIDDGRQGLLDSKEEVCLSDLEESKILEEVFFI